jgi:hypothetical protein
VVYYVFIFLFLCPSSPPIVSGPLTNILTPPGLKGAVRLFRLRREEHGAA